MCDLNRRQLVRGFFLAVALVPGLAWSQDRVVPPENVTYEANVVYGTGADQELHLDLALPRNSTGQVPCVVVIHGGAWRGGRKDDQVMNEFLFRFAKNGYAAATVQYRLCPQHPFPAQVEDVKCAVRFLRANAEKYHLDPQRIGAFGVSAGAHLAMMLGTMDGDDGCEGTGGCPEQSSQVQAVVSVAGPTQLDADDIPAISVPLITDFLGGTVQTKAAEAKQASPITYVTAGDAPMLLLQGTKDPLVPHTQAYRMADALTKAGVPGRIELYLGAGHGWGGKDLEHSLRRMDEFLERYLKPSTTSNP